MGLGPPPTWSAGATKGEQGHRWQSAGVVRESGQYSYVARTSKRRLAMIGRRELPPAYSAWNRKWGAPYGYKRGQRLRRFISPRVVTRFPRLVGPFGLQSNNSIREWEYPWAFRAVPVGVGDTVVDVGGSLGGLQFVLARTGATVINVDPGDEAAGLGWPVDTQEIDRLNASFGTSVTLRDCRLEEAALDDASIDTVYSISTLEHIPKDDLWPLIAEIERVLAPGGHFVATVDLFLDLEPFSTEIENKWGVNIDLFSLLGSVDLILVQGEPQELLGFPGFDSSGIMARLSSFHIGRDYPALAQCFVLRKPSPTHS